MNTRHIMLPSFLICLLLATQVALSLEIPERPKGRVSDYAGLLTNEQIATLDARLQGFEEETTSQVAVAIFKSLEGESLEDFSIRLAEQWKIGTEERDNGVILLIFLDDRKLRIEVGYGLEGVLTDATASSIIRNDITPYFRDGDYYGGVEAGIEKIIEATRGEYRAEPDSYEQKDTGWENLLVFALLFIILPFFIFPIFARRRGYYTFGPGGWYSGGGYSGGGGSSDGGYSGGGGDFGGGGASGDW